MNIIENKESPINTDCSSTSSIIDDEDRQEPSLNYYNSLMPPKNPFGILSMCLPSSKMFQSHPYTNQRYDLVQPYPISPHAYFANMAKYTETTGGMNIISTNNNNAICVVCGDIASGKHYGLLSCNGCSGFFKRSVRRKLIYRCQSNTGTCIVDKAHRNQCQACRLKKCLQMGMIKDAVQNERQPRTRSQIRSDSINFHYDGNETTISAVDHRPPQQTNSTSGSSPMIKQDNECDLVNNPDDTVHATSAQILLMIIKWIRNLPTFSNLPIHDQLILLEESWSELFLLWAIQGSTSLDDGGPFFNSILDRKNENDRLMNGVFYIFKQLKLDPIEYACLKGIILFRFDSRSLKEEKIIEDLQDQAQITLAQYAQIHNPTQPTRFGRLLLTLPLLRSIPSIFIEKTYFSRTIGNTSMSKLLAEMFKN